MDAAPTATPLPNRLRVLSANIQAGVRTDRYRHYVTRSLSHVLPHRDKQANLRELASSLLEFDLVGLQEADAGSLRSGFSNQTEQLAEWAEFPYWSHQPNRRIGRIASSANGLLSRVAPYEVRDYALPGRLRGRGALWVRYATQRGDLLLLIAHLSLGKASRVAQLAFLAELLHDAPRAILLGDLNCPVEAPEMRLLFRNTRLTEPLERLPSYPSWQPRRAIDHVLVTEGVHVHRRWLLPSQASDHLALAADVEIS